MTTYEYLDCSDDDRRQPLIFIELLPFHRQIRLKRQYDQFTILQLSKHLKIGEGTLTDVENGKRRIPFHALERVKNYLYNEMYIDGVLQTGKEDYYG